MPKDNTQEKTKYVPCPTCKEPALFSTDNRYRPFCSERCKMIDLGDWASENYKIPDKTPPKDFDDIN